MGADTSYYSDYTFGVWVDDQTLVPVGKTELSTNSPDLSRIDKYVRDNTIEKFGPVRSVTAQRDVGLVFEVEYEGLSRSKRHKSGLTMRNPNISHVHWGKKPGDANGLESLKTLLS